MLSQFCISRATRRQILSCSMGLMAGFVYGCKVGFIESTSSLFMTKKSPFSVTRNEISWMGSISHTGSLLSVILSYILTNKISAKIFILTSVIVYTVCWLVLLLTSSIKVVIGCLFFYGVAASIAGTVMYIYVSEITTPENRELLILLYPLGSALGVQFENLIAMYDIYKLLAAFPLLIGILTILMSIFMVESPYYLISIGKHEEAVKNLRWLHDKSADENMSVELTEIENYVGEQRNIGISDFKTVLLPHNLELLGALTLIGLPGTINCNTVTYVYGSVVIRDLEEYVNGALFTNICSAIRTFCTLFAVVTVKKFKRRVLIMYGLIFAGLIELSCSFCFYLERRSDYKWEFVAQTIACLLALYMVVSGTMVSPAFSVLKSEVLPHRLKEFYLSFLVFKSDLLAFSVVKSYFWLSDLLGMDYLLLLYSSFYLLGIPCAYIFIRDTKGKSLNQIRIDYGNDDEETNNMKK